MAERTQKMLSAGAIVVHEGKILLDYRTRQDDYTFPKGHVEPGESIEQAAIREVKEEMGCDIELQEELPLHSYTHPQYGLMNCHMFLARLVSEGEKIEENDNPVWMSIEEAKKKLTYENLRAYLVVVEGKLR